MPINYPTNLKAISIHAPFAYAICLGLKTEEYRTQPTKRRGWVLIHASQSKASDEYFITYNIDKSGVKRGAIIGAVQITDCTGTDGNWAYQLNSPVLFEQPVEDVRGKQAIFWGANSRELQEAFTLASQQIAKFLNVNGVV
ncbi:hypothetical protein CAL7716_101490 (plasmid) [Calothrix sp. PCC 7716]|nr:hypothetical protein CAL7716_101490 [Calothrix sp. PCC 7716]